MTKFSIVFGEPMSSCYFEGESIRGLGYAVMGSFVFTEKEMREAIKDYLKQRVAHRRRLRFVDPGVS